MGNVTLSDIAEKLGISTMTASRALNGKPGVSDNLRSLVRKEATLLGYRPNRAARGLASRKTATLGIVIPDIANPFFAILVREAINVARGLDRNVFVMNTDEDPRLERQALDSLAGEAIDGILVAGSRLPQAELNRIVQSFPAAVLVNRDPSGNRVRAVNIDDRRGTADAVGYLAAQGKRRIACILGPRTSVSGRRRLSGYLQGLSLAGHGMETALTQSCIPTMDGGAEAMEKLLEKGQLPDAVVTYNDLVAIGAMRAIEGRGLKIPEDIAVIGADDVPYASLVRPSLTTMAVNLPSIGSSAMTILLALSRGLSPESPPFVVPRIVCRDSA